MSAASACFIGVAVLIARLELPCCILHRRIGSNSGTGTRLVPQTLDTEFNMEFGSRALPGDAPAGFLTSFHPRIDQFSGNIEDMQSYAACPWMRDLSSEEVPVSNTFFADDAANTTVIEGPFDLREKLFDINFEYDKALSPDHARNHSEQKVPVNALREGKLEEQDKALAEKFFNAFDPSAPELDHIIPVFRKQKCYDHETNGFKLFFRLREEVRFPRVAGPGQLSKENFENMLVKIFKEAGGKQHFGQAPKGSLERRAQQLLDELGA